MCLCGYGSMCLRLCMPATGVFVCVCVCVWCGCVCVSVCVCECVCVCVCVCVVPCTNGAETLFCLPASPQVCVHLDQGVQSDSWQLTGHSTTQERFICHFFYRTRV